MKKFLATAALACGLAAQSLFAPVAASAAPIHHGPTSVALADSGVIIVACDDTGCIIIIIIFSD